MVEQSLGVEDRVLGLPQEAGLSDAAEDQRSGDFAAGGIEAMISELDCRIRHSPPLKRRKQGLKPMRVLVEDG
jgi:hypothetical protein